MRPLVPHATYERTNERMNGRSNATEQTSNCPLFAQIACPTRPMKYIQMQILIIPMKYQVFLIHVVRVGTNQTTAGKCLVIGVLF